MIDYLFSGTWDATLVLFACFLVVFLGLYYLVKFLRVKIPQMRNKSSVKKAGEGSGVLVLRNALANYIALREAKAAFGVTVTGKKGDTMDIDALLVGYYGVSVFVACDYPGEIYLDKTKPQISCVVLGEKIKIDNPYLRAEAAARAVRETLTGGKIYGINVEPVVVVTNKRSKVVAPRSLEFFTPKTLKKALKKARFLEDKGVDVDAVFNTLTKEQ